MKTEIPIANWKVLLIIPKDEKYHYNAHVQKCHTTLELIRVGGKVFYVDEGIRFITFLWQTPYSHHHLYFCHFCLQKKLNLHTRHGLQNAEDGLMIN